MSRLVDRGSIRGLMVRRDADEDGRVTLVELTSDGQRLAREFQAALEKQTRELRAGWRPEGRKRAAKILNEIAEALEGGQRRGAAARPR